MTRDQLIDKLRKLSAFTTANGCTEAEAARAAELITRLMAEHNVNQTEVEIRQEAAGCIKDTFVEIISGRDVPATHGVLGAMNKLFSIKSWWSASKEDYLGLGIETDIITVTCFGFKADVAAAIAVGEIITAAVRDETNTFLAGKRRMNAFHKREMENSFRRGMTDRLKDRLLELCPAPKPTGTALIVLKDQLVKQELDKLGMKFKSSTSLSANNASAYSAGQSAASRVDLGHGRKVEGTRALPSR